MKMFIRDFRHGLRHLKRSPGSLFLAILAFALGIGLVATNLTLTFSIGQAKPTILPDYEEMVSLDWDPTTRDTWRKENQSSRFFILPFKDFEAQNFEYIKDISGFYSSQRNLMINNQPTPVSVNITSGRLFDLIQHTPLRGRLYGMEDALPSSAPVIIISAELWREEFRSKESAIGERVQLDGTSYEIIGVADEGFDLFPSGVDIWRPLSDDPAKMKRTSGMAFRVMGRLKGENALENARSELNEFSAQLVEIYPDAHQGLTSVRVRPVMDTIGIGRNSKKLLAIMLICSIFVLLIACANVANIMLSRATLRSKELAVRSALGARRSRLIRQMLTEGLVVAVSGGLLGLLLAQWLNTLVWAKLTTQGGGNNMPSWMSMEMSWEVVSLLFLATLLASVLASIVPAWRSSGINFNESLKDAGRSNTGLKAGAFSRALTLFQVAASLALLIGTIAMTNWISSLMEFDPPYDPDKILVARTILSEELYDTQAKRMQFIKSVLDESRQIPGIQNLEATTAYGVFQNWPSTWEIEGVNTGGDDQAAEGCYAVVSSGYFKALGISVLEGRLFDSMDTPDSDPICVVNTLFAERNWPGESPIGKRIKNQRVDYYPWRRVVGVVSDAKMAGPGGTRTHEGVYESYSQYVPELSNVYFFLVAEGNPMTFAPELRSTITRIDPALNLNYVDTISEVLDRNTGGLYIIIGLFGAMSGAALFLAAIGLYGVISCSVNQRTFEFGIRMALGAVSRDILRRVLRNSLIELGGGTVLGIIFGTILITGLRSSFSGGNSEPNPAWNSIGSYGYPVLILLIVGVVAALGPALRAIRMSPTDALRDE